MDKLFKGYRKIKTPIKGKGNYTLWVADTPAKQKLGLSGIKKLPKRHGMIFTYDSPVDHAFTMEKTSIPLTIMFLDKNFGVIDVFNCRPFQKKSVKPRSKYSYVVEI